MAMSSHRNKAAIMPLEPWVSRSFQKDSKLRTVERYFRDPSDLSAALSSSSSSQQGTAVSVARIIPDALIWRKYLRLLRTVITEYCCDLKIPFQWILTESAVELMDHRNQSLKEAAAPQERSVLQRLVKQQQQQQNNECVALFAFADVSVRHSEHDEWDLLHYETMDLNERSRQAQVRAAGLISSSCISSTTTANSSTNNASCWLLVDDSSINCLPLDDDQNVKYVSIFDVINSLATYLPSRDHVERLLEMQRTCEEEYTRRNAPPAAADDAVHEALNNLSEDEIRKRLQNGTLLRGRLNVTKENAKESYVTAGNQTFFVDHVHVNNAFHQDIVIIEPLPESQWGRPIGRRRLVYHAGSSDGDDEDSSSDVGPNNNNNGNNDFSAAVPSARVVSVDQPGRRIFVATMTDVPTNADEGAVLLIPMDVRIPKIRVRTRTWRQRFEGQRLKVEVTAWEAGSHHPAGRCVEVLGPIGDMEVEIKALLIENQVELEPFSAEALASLPAEGVQWKVTDEEIRKRRDLRTSRRVFSVDPPGCQDIDDTMHAEVLPNGDIEVGVHIADVTYFVKHNSQLDKEAQVRGTTFYLVDRRFDMLPGLLSADLCSLHGGIDRLAVSAIWILSSDLKEVKSTWFGRTVIRNCAAMTYDQADNILHDRPPEEPGKPHPPPLTAGSPVDLNLVASLKRDLTMLTRLARKRRKDREEIGNAVDLSGDESGGELKFTLESGKPTKVAPKQDKEIHHTIAEMMIMANTDVATRIHRNFPDSALLRIHRSVDESRFEELRAILKSAGVELDGNDGNSLAKSLKEAQRNFRSKNSPFQSLLLSIATRAMTEAQYVCTGDVTSGSDLSHYGLGLQEYTHFTSPIRRYCDVIVHKQLLASLSTEFASRSRAKFDAKPEVVHVEPLETLPDSQVISILAGEGLHESVADGEEDDELIDFLTEGASNLVLGTDTPTLTEEVLPVQKNEEASRKPYVKSEVSSICDGLNLHNRLAKHSSYECQSLFLSLYFKDHADITQAVVTNLRENGFFVYVPKYDLRGPVYIRDTNGDVQIDPSFLGLPRGSGAAATMGFITSGSCRRFPDGKCELFDGTNERLEVSVAGSTKKFVLRPFDVVNVDMTCDNWDVRARVPAPRLLLTMRTPDVPTDNPSSKQVNITSEKLKLNHQQSRQATPLKERGDSDETSSIFEVLTNARRRHRVLHEVPCRSSRAGIQVPDRKELLRGRVVYGDFTNPETRSAVQDAAQRVAAEQAAERRVNLLESSSQRTEFDTARSIERNVTMRQQRLATDKRNTRHSKAK